MSDPSEGAIAALGISGHEGGNRCQAEKGHRWKHLKHAFLFKDHEDAPADYAAVCETCVGEQAEVTIYQLSFGADATKPTRRAGAEDGRVRLVKTHGVPAGFVWQKMCQRKELASFRKIAPSPYAELGSFRKKRPPGSFGKGASVWQRESLVRSATQITLNSHKEVHFGFVSQNRLSGQKGGVGSFGNLRLILGSSVKNTAESPLPGWVRSVKTRPSAHPSPEC